MQTENILRGRFAPSPSGRMHLGNIYSALISYLSVKKNGGEWVVRIEDLDRQRCKAEYADMLLSDLDWLGLHSDVPIIYQSKRNQFYVASLAKLSEQGLTYGCFCRRADILSAQAPHETDGRVVYQGKCRSLSAEQRTALSAERKPATRVIVPNANIAFTDGHYGLQSINLAQHCGDFVVRRADGNFAYQLAVVVDDAAQGITEVVRGRDLLTSTHQQIFLYEQLGCRVPRFSHLPLLVSDGGVRLAKRDRVPDMGVLRQMLSAEQLIGKVMFMAHQLPCEQPMSLSEAVSVFSWSKLPTSDIVVGN